jgi:cytochrome oxidase Cu insertion factor (SCO1/SenC/PrrC family)
VARVGRRIADGAELSWSRREEAVAIVIMSAMLTAGVTAPELDSVVDQDGNPVRLADLRGKWVLLWWYPMADTPG